MTDDSQPAGLSDAYKKETGEQTSGARDFEAECRRQSLRIAASEAADASLAGFLEVAFSDLVQNLESEQTNQSRDIKA